MGIKNIWSLNVDELLVASKIQSVTGKRYQVFYPLNTTLADIDLALVNLDSYQIISIQVKGSRTYEPRKIEVERYGAGGSTWFVLNKEKTFHPGNKVDFYIFVLHSFEDGLKKKEIVINFLVMPAKDIQTICQQKRTRKGGSRYDFFVWIDSKGKRAFDIEGGAGNKIEMSRYLNNWDILMKS